MLRSSRVRTGSLLRCSILPPTCIWNVRSVISISFAPSTSSTASPILAACSSPAVSIVMSRSVWPPSIATRSTEPMLPPASPMAVATRPSMPGRWSISTRRMIEYCAETGGIPRWWNPSDGYAIGHADRTPGPRPRSVAARLGGRARDDHVDPRHDDRQRRDRDAGARPGQLAVLHPVGVDRLPARPGHGHPAHGLGHGALRRGGGLGDFGDAFPLGFGPWAAS